MSICYSVILQLPVSVQVKLLRCYGMYKEKNENPTVTNPIHWLEYWPWDTESWPPDFHIRVL